jgi:hypothetical protein
MVALFCHFDSRVATADKFGVRRQVTFTPLGLTIERKNLTMAKWLLAKGANVEKKFGGGKQCER